jgi:hypothetical protein
MRAVIALSRFGGIRTPSETVALTWADIDFAAGRMTIRASKTAHHEDGGIRFCPLFPELRPYLLALHDRANPGLDCPMSTTIITRWRSGDQNLRTAFLKLLEKAGIKAWPKLYQNLRASRETELLAQFPAKDVCDWLGNTQAVAMKHYTMATSESFERAVGSKAEQDAGDCSISVDQELSGDGPEMQKPSKTNGFEGFRELPTGVGVPRLGLEVSPETKGKPHNSGSVVLPVVLNPSEASIPTDARDAALKALIAVWQELPDSTVNGILKLVQAAETLAGGGR